MSSWLIDASADTPLRWIILVFFRSARRRPPAWLSREPLDLCPPSLPPSLPRSRSWFLPHLFLVPPSPSAVVIDLLSACNLVTGERAQNLIHLGWSQLFHFFSILWLWMPVWFWIRNLFFAHFRNDVFATRSYVQIGAFVVEPFYE